MRIFRLGEVMAAKCRQSTCSGLEGVPAVRLHMGFIRGVPQLKTGIRHLIAFADSHLDNLIHSFHQVDVKIHIQVFVFNLSAQQHVDRGQHTCHPVNHVGIVAIGYRHFFLRNEQRGLAVLVGLNALELHVTHSHRTVFAVEYEVFQTDVIQSVVLNDRELAKLLRRHIVDNHCDGYDVICCAGDNSRHRNQQ